MIDAGSLNRRKGGGKAWLAALIFLLTITVVSLSVTLAAEPDIRKGLQSATTGQQPSSVRSQNSAQQVVAKQQAQSKSPG